MPIQFTKPEDTSTDVPTNDEDTEPAGGLKINSATGGIVVHLDTVVLTGTRADDVVFENDAYKVYLTYTSTQVQIRTTAKRSNCKFTRFIRRDSDFYTADGTTFFGGYMSEGYYSNTYDAVSGSALYSEIGNYSQVLNIEYHIHTNDSDETAVSVKTYHE